METFQEKIQKLIITYIKRTIEEHNSLNISDEKLLYTLKNLLKHDEYDNN